MTEKIVSKVFNYGNENESTWPSQFGTGERGVFHVKDGKVVSGYPENPHPPLDRAPMVLFDSMPSTYHEGAQRVIESRKEWEMADKQHGVLTFGNIEEVKRHTSKGIQDEQKALKEDRKKADRRALEAYKSNPREIKQKLRKNAEAQIKTLKKAGLTKQLKESGIKYDD